MSISVDPDETAHYEPSHLDLCCLQRPIIIACGSEKVKLHVMKVALSLILSNRKSDNSLLNLHLEKSI